MSRIARRQFLKRATALLGAGGMPSLYGGVGGACAQGSSGADTSWPNRPVRFIVPLAAGGGLDFVARVVGEHMSRELGQQVFIENRTGAGGTIGIDMAIKSAARRLFGAHHQRQHRGRAACAALEHRLPQGIAAGLPARAGSPRRWPCIRR